MQTGTSSNMHNHSPGKSYSPTSPKFKESSIMNVVKDYNRIEFKHENQSYTGTDSKMHTPEKHNKSVTIEETPVGYGDYSSSIKQGGSSLNKPIDSHANSQASSQAKDLTNESIHNKKLRHSPLRNPPPAQATLNLSNLQNLNTKTITIVHPTSTSSNQNTLKNAVNTPQNNFLNRLNEVQGSASSKMTGSDLPTSILGNTLSSQISVVSPNMNTNTSGFAFNKSDNRNQSEQPIHIQQNAQNERQPGQPGHRPTMSFNKDYEVNQFSNVSPAVLDIINNYRISKNNSPNKKEGTLSQNASQQQIVTNPNIFSIPADYNSKNTDTDIQINSEDVRIADPQYTHINFDRIEKRKSIVSLTETNLTPSHYNPSPSIQNSHPLDRFRGPLLGPKSSQSNPSSSQFNYSISENSQLVSHKYSIFIILEQ